MGQQSVAYKISIFRKTADQFLILFSSTVVIVQIYSNILLFRGSKDSNFQHFHNYIISKLYNIATSVVWDPVIASYANFVNNLLVNL